MNCVICESSDVTIFFVEEIPCSHCNNVTEVSYNACQNCGAVWKTIGDEVVEDMVFTNDDVNTALMDILDDSEIVAIVSDSNKNTMEEIVHKCIKCNSISYEVKHKLFHCPNCGFEWEVI